LFVCWQYGRKQPFKKSKFEVEKKDRICPTIFPGHQQAIEAMDYDAQKFIKSSNSLLDLKAKKNKAVWIWPFQISETMSDKIIPIVFFRN
jgi:hypothetical protein